MKFSCSLILLCIHFRSLVLQYAGHYFLKFFFFFISFVLFCLFICLCFVFLLTHYEMVNTLS